MPAYIVFVFKHTFKTFFQKEKIEQKSAFLGIKAQLCIPIPISD